MPSIESNQLLLAAAAACEDKKAEDIRILALDPAESGLTDYFLICNGTNERQNVAITDEIEMRLKREFGVYPNSVEGRRQGEWILMDYVDFIVHVFSAGEARLLRPRAPAQIRHHHQRRRPQRRVEGRRRRHSRAEAKIASKNLQPQSKVTSEKAAASQSGACEREEAGRKKAASRIEEGRGKRSESAEKERLEEGRVRRRPSSCNTCRTHTKRRRALSSPPFSLVAVRWVRSSASTEIPSYAARQCQRFPIRAERASDRDRETCSAR